MRQTVIIGNMRMSLRVRVGMRKIPACYSHPSPDSTVEHVSLLLAHDSQEGVSVEDGLGRVWVVVLGLSHLGDVFDGHNVALLDAILVKSGGGRHGFLHIGENGRVRVGLVGWLV